jgi:hypothetical protein
MAAYNNNAKQVTQSFTAKAGTLDSVVLYLKKVGAPTGNALVKLYAITGTYGSGSRPTGPALATSTNSDVSTYSTSPGLITFTFTGANKYVMTAGTYYIVDYVFTGGNPSNYTLVGNDTSGTHSGDMNYSYDNSTWHDSNSVDAAFYVYKDEPDSVVSATSSNQIKSSMIIKGNTIFK